MAWVKGTCSVLEWGAVAWGRENLPMTALEGAVRWQHRIPYDEPRLQTTQVLGKIRERERKRKRKERIYFQRYVFVFPADHLGLCCTEPRLESGILPADRYLYNMVSVGGVDQRPRKHIRFPHFITNATIEWQR